MIEQPALPGDKILVVGVVRLASSPVLAGERREGSAGICKHQRAATATNATFLSGHTSSALGTRNADSVIASNASWTLA